MQQNSHLLETPLSTESQTGPSQQIDYNRLAREIVNLQNSPNNSATGNNHSDHFQLIDFPPNQHTDEDQFGVQSQQVQNQSVNNVLLIQNQNSTETVTNDVPTSRQQPAFNFSSAPSVTDTNVPSTSSAPPNVHSLVDCIFNNVSPSTYRGTKFFYY